MVKRPFPVPRLATGGLLLLLRRCACWPIPVSRVKDPEAGGRSEMPEITSGDLPGLMLGKEEIPGASGYWLLSLFHPSSEDQVDWTQGNYALHTRNGRVESQERHGDAKKPTRMVAEGSVLVASSALLGEATNVAPDGFPHPVYRSGFALALPLPVALARVPLVRPAPPAPPVPPTQMELVEPEFVSPDDQAADLAVDATEETASEIEQTDPPPVEDAE